MPLSPALKPSLVSSLVADPSPERRVDTIGAVADSFAHAKLGPAERAIAEEILRLAARDAEERVRAALVVRLRHSRNLPRDVAMSLALDVERVAVPLLEVSQVFTDDDLIEIVQRGKSYARCAIAGRPSVSAAVGDALIESGDEIAVARLVSNLGSEIQPSGFNRIVDQYGKSPVVQKCLVERPLVPIEIAERLLTLVTDALRKKLLARHPGLEGVLNDAMMAARERAVLGLVGPRADEGDVLALVRHMRYQSRLTPSIILRALFIGDLAFFEAALAEKTGLPVMNVRKLVHDPGRTGLEAVYRKADLPNEMLPAVWAAIEVSLSTAIDFGERDRSRYSRRVIERLLTQKNNIAPEHVNYLFNRLDELTIACGAM